MTRRLLSIAAAAAFLAAPLPCRALDGLMEVPFFMEAVRAQRLPSVEQRVPDEPAIAAFGRPGQRIGRQGGDLRILMASPRETRMLVVYGYARLVGYDYTFDIVPDILEAVDVVEDRIFTLRLRRGHKWSDGHPFTTADFRFWWEDVANNKDLSPAGVPRELMVDGELPQVTFIDAATMRFAWKRPNPYFLPSLAAPSPLYIYEPAHYLKQFHKRYADPAALKKLVERAGRRNWAALFNRVDNAYRNDNPDLPTLDPWVLKTRPPANRFVFERNPYYHRIDAWGQQLPYLDQVIMNIADAKIIPLKTGSGETDLQARYLRFDNYTFLKQGEKRNAYKLHLWRTAYGAHVVLYPNLNHKDPAWRELFRDVRFRRALSLAINRHEINQVVFFGLALEGNNTVLPDSPMHRPEYRAAWAKFDLKQANALLDSMGLSRRDSRGVRLLPDGRPLEIVVETAGESTEQTDVLELIGDSWLKAGIKLYSRPSQREVFRNRIFAGETQMAVWTGIENGLPTPDTPPDEFVPTSQQQLQWPKWGQHHETGGRSGEPVDMAAPRELARLREAWLRATARIERARVWRRILEIHAEEVFTIGLIGAVPQPVVADARLRNIPDQGVYNWDPGAHFGIYRPDQFWLDKLVQEAAR